MVVPELLFIEYSFLVPCEIRKLGMTSLTPRTDCALRHIRNVADGRTPPRTH